MKDSHATPEDLNRLFAVQRTLRYVNAFYGPKHKTTKIIAEVTSQAAMSPDRIRRIRITDAASLTDELLQSLTENERRAIFNGWLPDPLMRPQRIANRTFFVPVLEFDPLTSDGMVISADDAEWYRGNAVTLRIKEGSTLIQVMDALAELNRHVPRWFNRAIASNHFGDPIDGIGKRGIEVRP